MQENTALAPKLMITRFITSFLPEVITVNKSSNTELTYVTGILNILFTKMYGMHLNPDLIFEAFESLTYGISVIEPRKPSRTSQPYIETNSHAIFINISPLTMHDMEILANYEENNNKSLSMESGELLLKLELFNSL